MIDRKKIFTQVTDKIINTEMVISSEFDETHKIAKDSIHGAEVFFIGKVRNLNHEKKVVAVAYDAFAPLTEKIFTDLANEAQTQWGNNLIIKIIHRTGKLLIDEISVLITVSSKHRDEAYEASRYIIEQLKVRSPIWKKEYYENGETEWLQGHALCQHSHNTNHLSWREVIKNGAR